MKREGKLHETVLIRVDSNSCVEYMGNGKWGKTYFFREKTQFTTSFSIRFDFIGYFFLIKRRKIMQ